MLNFYGGIYGNKKSQWGWKSVFNEEYRFSYIWDRLQKEWRFRSISNICIEKVPDGHNSGTFVWKKHSTFYQLRLKKLTVFYQFDLKYSTFYQLHLNRHQGATVKIKTSRWISFHKKVVEALVERPDVTLEIGFLDEEYKGNRITATIPAGTDVLSLVDENGFVGFLYLVLKYGFTIQ